MSLVLVSRAFSDGLQRLTSAERQRTLSTVRTLHASPRHPSLHAHRVLSVTARHPAWEVYITGRSLRLIFSVSGEPPTLRLWFVGSHQILASVRRCPFDATRLQSVSLDELGA